MQFTTSADGTNIAWYDYGGDGPNLLFAHATGFCGRIWEPIIKRMRYNFRCLAYDARGHGLSNSPKDDRHPYTQWHWDRLADDAGAVLRDAAVHNVHVIGHSSGATTALLLEQGHAGTFARMCLFEPVLFPHIPPIGPNPHRDIALQAKKRRRHFPSAQDARARFGERGPFSQLDTETLDAYVSFGFTHDDNGIALRCDPEDEAMIYTTASAHDAFTHLDAVQCPTLVIAGEKSKAFSHEDLRAAAARFPHGTFSVMADVTHFGPLERPREFVSCASNFLTTMDPTK